MSSPTAPVKTYGITSKKRSKVCRIDSCTNSEDLVIAPSHAIAYFHLTSNAQAQSTKIFKICTKCLSKADTYLQV